MAMTESQKKYEKKRMEKCKSYTTKYRLYIDAENTEQKRLEAYLDQTGQSANAYIKKLIKNDLDEKGFMIDMVDTVEQVDHVSGSDNNDNIS